MGRRKGGKADYPKKKPKMIYKRKRKKRERGPIGHSLLCSSLIAVISIPPPPTPLPPARRGWLWGGLEKAPEAAPLPPSSAAAVLPLPTLEPPGREASLPLVLLIPVAPWLGVTGRDEDRLESLLGVLAGLLLLLALLLE